MLDKLKSLVLDAAEQLKKSDLKVVTAESCTGGGLCYWLTSVPGSSQWVERGFVTYSNQAKMEMLDVPAKILDTHGAVSNETACAMAAGALLHSAADLAVSITGIAGPDKDNTDKPVGTVWIGWSGKDIDTDAVLHQFKGDRQAIRIQSMIAALEVIIKNSYK